MDPSSPRAASDLHVGSAEANASARAADDDRSRTEAVLQVEHDLALRLAEARDIEEIARRSFDAALAATNLDAGGVYVVDPSNGEMRLVYHRGHSPAFIRLVTRFPGDARPARVVQAGQMVIYTPDVLADPSFSTIRAEGIQVFAIIPVHCEGQVVASLHISSTRKSSLSEFECAAIQAIAAQMGGAITRARLAAAQRASDERYRSIVSTTTDGFWYLDRAGRIVEVNEACCQLLGYSAEELQSMRVWQLDAQPDRAAWAARFSQLQAVGRLRYEARHRHHDGSLLDLDVSMTHAGRAGEGYFAFLRDVTERKIAEAALLASEARYRQIVETTNEGVMIVGGDRRLLFVNRRMADLLGYEVEELTRCNFDELSLPEEQSQRDIQWESRMRGQPAQYERRLRRKDGSHCWVLVSASPLVDDAGCVLGSLAMLRDISSQRESDRKLAELDLQLQHAARLATLGELSAAIAHEVNQPLCTIVNFAKACRNLTDQSQPDLALLRQWCEAIARAAVHGGDVVRNLRGYARQASVPATTVSLASLIEDALLLVRFDAQSRAIALCTELPDGECLVRVHPVQIHQVLVNLLRNALESFTEGDQGQILLRVRRQDGVATVSVRDQGRGLSGIAANDAFRPLMSTKPDGLGMGLAICRTIVEKHSGQIWIEPNSDRGITVHFTLPVC